MRRIRAYWFMDPQKNTFLTLGGIIVKKAVKVLSTATLAATLVAPVAVVAPVYASSTYSTSTIKSVPAGQLAAGQVTRVTVQIPAGTLTTNSTMRLRLPADAYGKLNGVTNTAATFSSATTGATAQVHTITVSGGPAAAAGTATVTVGGTPVNVSIGAGEADGVVASNIAAALSSNITVANNFTATVTGNVVTLTAKAPASDVTIVSNGDTATTGITLTGVNTTNGSAGIPGSPYVPVSADGSATGKNQVGSIQVTPINGTASGANEFEVQVNRDLANPSAAGLFYLDFSDVYVPSGTSGALKVTIESQDGLLSPGQVAIASVGSGSVASTIDDVNALQNKGTAQAIAPIRFKEDRPGALQAGKLSYKLPNGFKWASSSYTATRVWGAGGDGATITFNRVSGDDRKIEATIVGGSTEAAYYQLNGLDVIVDDAVAKAGDVEVSIDGKSSLSNNSLVVARYGDYGTTTTSADAPTVLAGQDGQEIGKITIAESAPGSLIDGRTIKLTLSGNAKWNPDALPKLDEALSDKQGVTFSGFTINPSDPSVITGTIGNASPTRKPGKLVFTKGEIDTAANASEQDVKVTVGGTAGATGEVTVAKMIPSVKVTAEGDLPKVVIGAQEQAIANFTITEAAKSVIDGKNQKLVLHFPTGVRPTLPAKVEVTDGDVVLDTSNISKDGQDIFIPVKYDSTKPSTIKVSGVKVLVDRTVAEGDLKVEVRGDAVVTTNKAIRDYDGNPATGTNGKEGIPFENNNVAGAAVIAKVVTPAAKDTTAQNIVFKLNSKTYTVDGKEFEMDAAPLVGWDRAYLPVRFAANALNVKDENIIWDDKTSTFTVFKGDRVVTGKVGDKFLTVNGVKVPMDVPVWRNKAQTNNRVMVPIRYLSNALGADIQWNQETSEITIGVK